MWLGFARARQEAAQLLRGAVVVTGHVVAHAQGVPPSCGEGVGAVMAQPRLSARFPLVHAACNRGVAAPSGVPERRGRGLPGEWVPEAAALAVFSAPSRLLPVPREVPQAARGGLLAVRVAAGGLQRMVALVPVMDAVARRHDIDPLLLHAIARIESRHRAQAVSHAGARGVMQVMPATARRFGVDRPEALHDAATNVEVSAVYLKRLQHRFGNDLPLVLAAYNAGEGAVERHGRRIPPYRETQAYVRGVLSEYDRLRQAVADQRLAPGARS